MTRYATWPDLLDYCRRSANPVGRLVLRIGGWRDAGLDEASDAVCSALQLTNFWQDLAVDWTRGRLYVPAQEYQRTGAVTDSLDQRQITPAWRDALAACAVRTRDLFTKGRAVCDGVSGRLRWELRLTWLGGTRILDRLEQGGYDVFADASRAGRRWMSRRCCGGRWSGGHEPRRPASTTRLSCCPSRSARRSSRCGTSAAQSMTSWMSRLAGPGPES